MLTPQQGLTPLWAGAFWQISELRTEMSERFDQIATTLDDLAKRIAHDGAERMAIAH
jgi:hypothetical protein